MAQKSGLKRFLLVLVFIILAVVAFALLGGGRLLKSMGSKTEEIKGSLEKSADTIEKKAEKVKDVMKSGDKK